jgi:hypothetical protein
MVLGIFAFMLAFMNLIRVHLGRIFRKGKNQTISLLFLISAIACLTIVMIQGPEGIISQQILNGVLIPGESALLGLTALSLTIAGMRILRSRRGPNSILFILMTIIFLVGMVPYMQVFGRFSDFFQNALATAGMRGIVIGVALGTTLTGLRVIFGTTRPYSDD